MRDCLIMGSGRSGTSMVAGALAHAGYFMGEELLGATEGNPFGYFEDHEVNAINEELLAPVVPARPAVLERFFLHRPRRNQRWLATLREDVTIPTPPRLQERIQRLIARRPFCFKDPRFSYTLEAWRPHLPESTLLVCIFRHPSRTAESILREKEREPYLRDLRIDFERACRVWTLMYRWILFRYAHIGHWLFLHYDQVLEGEGLRRLAAATGAVVDKSFPRSDLGRSPLCRPAPAEALCLYRALCERAALSGAVLHQDGLDD